jgi:arylformamidase
MNIIDISVSLSEKIPTWPGSIGYKSEKLMSFSKNDKVTVSSICLDVHTGTHIDAPLHFIENGETTDSIALDRFIGKCFVAEIKDEVVIKPKILETIPLPEGISRLLLKTSNSGLWKKNKFSEDFVALHPEASQWIVEKGIELIGIDYLSIQKFKGSDETHKILLRNQVIILEGINLSGVNEGIYNLICLPLKTLELEGSPCRAVLIN